MTQDKTSPKPRPGPTSTKPTDELKDFECALPFEVAKELASEREVENPNAVAGWSHEDDSVDAAAEFAQPR